MERPPDKSLTRHENELLDKIIDTDIDYQKYEKQQDAEEDRANDYD